MIPGLPHTETAVSEIAEIVRLAVAPVFLLAGIGAFLNVCAGRLARIVERARALEPRLLGSRGDEHDRILQGIRVLDRRMGLVSAAISLAVLSAVLTCAVVVLLFAGSLLKAEFGTTIALLFIACVLDRPRHDNVIAELRGLGCGIVLIPDGDVAGVMATADPDTSIDVYMGSGGAPEGVLAAAALRCVGGQIQGRLIFRNDDERKRAKRRGFQSGRRRSRCRARSCRR